MYEDFVPERIAKLRTQKGVSARDMSLSLGQANNYINNAENRDPEALKDFIEEGRKLSPEGMATIMNLMKQLNSK